MTICHDFGCQYMHSLNIDIEKMEEEIRQLDVEATQAVAENKGKDDQWQQVRLGNVGCKA